MLNPLTLPQAVIDGLAVLPALLKEAQAANRTLTEALERADRINAQADRLIAQADKILATASDAREVLERRPGRARPGQRPGGQDHRDGRPAGARRGPPGPDRLPGAPRYPRGRR